MRRIRIALALASFAVLGLVALLAWRANQGLAAEREMRHRARSARHALDAELQSDGR